MYSKIYFDENNNVCTYVKCSEIKLRTPRPMIKIINNFGIDCDGILSKLNVIIDNTTDEVKIDCLVIDYDKIFVDIIICEKNTFVVDDKNNLYIIDFTYDLNKIFNMKNAREIKYVHLSFKCIVVYCDDFLQIVVENYNKRINNVSNVKFYDTFIEATVNNKKYSVSYDYFPDFYNFTRLLCKYCILLGIYLVCIDIIALFTIDEIYLIFIISLISFFVFLLYSIFLRRFYVKDTVKCIDDTIDKNILYDSNIQYDQKSIIMSKYKTLNSNTVSRFAQIKSAKK